MRRLDSRSENFWGHLRALCAWEQDLSPNLEVSVREILNKVRSGGDTAMLELTERFDRWTPVNGAALEVPRRRQEAARGRLRPDLLEALRVAATRIRRFHEHQRQESWQLSGHDGTVVGQRVLPLERVGLYVPGGKAAYPSSVLMNALPAKVAGVEEIVMAVPAPDGELSDVVLAAALEAGVDRVFAVGGAQAIGALAYGTESIPAVDKIVGPGNMYVATAKRLVFGHVGIDMLAGPSEIVVVGDGTTRADWVAVDLFAQAEHDERARALLVSPDDLFIERVELEIDRLLPKMERRTTIAASLERQGALIRVRDLAEAAAVVNFIAPEHLELSVADPGSLLPTIRHAGAVFMGAYATEALGDYCAGPNHVLPTGRTARFSSPLGVYDFQKRSSVIEVDLAGATLLAPIVGTLARAEGLDAHSRSARLRVEGDDWGC